MSTKECFRFGDEGPGHLIIIGGGEDRRGDMRILERYVELCGGPDCSIAVLTSATTIPDVMWKMYDAAFGDLGVRNRFQLSVASRAEANEPDHAKRIYETDGIFMTGGSQQRLVEILGGTGVHAAMQRVFTEYGACIGGTSAGASAIARHMLANGTKEVLPDKHTARLDTGLGFLPHVAIDQHFSERQRLARLLSVIAQKPELIGVGVDEDTALVVGPNGHVEVLGSGAVTLLDGRGMNSNIAEVDKQERLELINVSLHLLPAGKHYDVGPAIPASDDDPAKQALFDVLRLVSRICHENT